MSRGPGEIQRAILAAARASGAGTFESMRWTVFEQLHGAVPVGGRLPADWNSSFSRALKGLDGRRIRVERRALASLEECVAHYPSKTLDADVRSQRAILLPALLEWTKEKSGPLPSHSTAENEEYFVRGLEPGELRKLRARWSQIEPEVRPHFAASGADELLHLLIKGRILFHGFDAKSRESFVDAARRCCGGSLLPESVAARLGEFSERFFGPKTAGSLRLKSFVHEFAFVPDRGRCSLKDPTKAALHQRRKAFVESMPGFTPPKRGLFGNDDPTYGKFMDKLFDHTVFQKFSFVLTEANHAATSSTKGAA